MIIAIKTLISSLALALFVSLSVQTQIASASGTSTADLLVLAEGDNTMAQRILGERYALGIEGVTQDMNQAVFWFRKAADKGDDEAQYYLGHMYRQGLGVPQDWVQAHMWFSLVGTASRKRIAPRDKELAEQNRKFAETKMTPRQIEEAQAMANEWRAKHKRPDQVAALQKMNLPAASCGVSTPKAKAAALRTAFAASSGELNPKRLIPD